MSDTPMTTATAKNAMSFGILGNTAAGSPVILTGAD
jgi:hypothetical protein